MKILLINLKYTASGNCGVEGGGSHSQEPGGKSKTTGPLLGRAIVK